MKRRLLRIARFQQRVRQTHLVLRGGHEFKGGTGFAQLFIGVNGAGDGIQRLVRVAPDAGLGKKYHHRINQTAQHGEHVQTHQPEKRLLGAQGVNRKKRGD